MFCSMFLRNEAKFKGFENEKGTLKECLNLLCYGILL